MNGSMVMAFLRRAGKRILWKTGLYPCYSFSANPFKILEWSAVKAEIEKDRGARVLDLGCGNGLQTILNGRYFGMIIGIDPDINAIRLAGDRLPYVKSGDNVVFRAGTVEEMRFEDNSFDGVLSYCVIEHIPNYREVFGELFRILKPGGWILFSVDSLATIKDDHLLKKHQKEQRVVQYFSPRGIRDLLTETGYEVSVCKPVLTSMFAEAVFRSGIGNDFRFNRCAGLFYGMMIFAAERITTRKDEGLFILVKASKPPAA